MTTAHFQRTGSKAQYRIAWIPGAKGIYTLGAKRKARQGKFLNPILTEPPLFTAQPDRAALSILL